MAEKASERDRKKDLIRRASESVVKGIFGAGLTAGEMAVASAEHLSSAKHRRQFSHEHEPLAPRGKSKGGSGIRIPVRSQQSIAEAMDRRKGRNR